MRAAPIHCRHWISKHSTGICGTSKMMKRWGKRLTDTCPRCPEVEDVSHVWTCQAPAATHIWQAAINGLQIWFREQKKQLPALLTQFVHGYVHGTVLHLMSHRSLITLGYERFLSSKIYWVDSHCLKGVQPVDGQRYSTAIFYGWEVNAPVDAVLLLSSRNFGRLHGLSGITAIVFYTQRNLTRQMSFRLLGSDNKRKRTTISD
jgi:hypothetical protein